MRILGITASSASPNALSGAFTLIQQLSPSAVSTVTFSSIPSTYKSLQVRFNTIASGAFVYQVQFNSDTSTANYVGHNLNANSATVNASGYASGTNGSIRINASNPGASTYPSVGIVDIIDYANTNKNKTVKALYGTNQNLTTFDQTVSSGIWLSTAAITSLTFGLNSGTITGTVTLYGVN
jgi:hydroxypyruvate isomerase